MAETWVIKSSYSTTKPFELTITDGSGDNPGTLVSLTPSGINTKLKFASILSMSADGGSLNPPAINTIMTEDGEIITVNDIDLNIDSASQLTFTNSPVGQLREFLLKFFYDPNQYYTGRVILNGTEEINILNDSVTPETLSIGVSAHDKYGRRIIGTKVDNNNAIVWHKLNN